MFSDNELRIISICVDRGRHDESWKIEEVETFSRQTLDAICAKIHRMLQASARMQRENNGR